MGPWPNDRVSPCDVAAYRFHTNRKVWENYMKICTNPFFSPLKNLHATTIFLINGRWYVASEICRLRAEREIKQKYAVEQALAHSKPTFSFCKIHTLGCMTMISQKIYIEVVQVVFIYLRRTPPRSEALRHSGGESRLWTSATVTLYLDVELSRLRRPGTEQNTSVGDCRPPGITMSRTPSFRKPPAGHKG